VITLSEIAKRLADRGVQVVHTEEVVNAALRELSTDDELLDSVRRCWGAGFVDDGTKEALEQASELFSADFWEAAGAAALDVEHPHHDLAYALVRGLRAPAARRYYRALILPDDLGQQKMIESVKLLGAIGQPEDADLIVDRVLPLEDGSSVCAALLGLEYLILHHGPNPIESACRRLLPRTGESCVRNLLEEHYPSLPPSHH
jgi:hypothetical protein